jgi:hypothetical protein
MPGTNTLAYYENFQITVVQKFYRIGTCGLYYKPMMIVNEDSRVVNKLKTSLTDNARVIIYNRHIFIVQATGVNVVKLFFFVADEEAK